MTVRFLGVDLAWGEGIEKRPANRSGVVALEREGTISDPGWTIGLLFVDAPLVIANETGQAAVRAQRRPALRQLLGLGELHQPRLGSASRRRPEGRA